MRQIVLLGLLLGAWTCSFAQTVTVVDGGTKQPVELATFYSEKPRASAVTNTLGQVEISSFAGSEKISISFLGYKTMELSYSKMAASDTLMLQPVSLNLDEVVVSAARWRQSSSKIPSKVVTISQDVISFQNPQTAADLLGLSGKVFIQKSQQGGGSPMIRGFATNRLIYTVDGVRMNTAIFRGGNIQNVISLDPFATEKTEVLFGPGSVIYGSDAIGGVMSFQTLTPELSLGEKALVNGSAVFRYSSANNERTGHFDINVGWKKWAMVTSFSSWNFDHLRQGSHGPDDYIKDYYVQRQDTSDVIITQDDPLVQRPSAYSQINLMQKLRFKPNEQWDFQYGFHYSETSPYGRYDRHNRVRNGTARHAEWNYGPQRWMMNNFSASHNGNNAVYDEMTIRLAHQRFEESRIDRSLNSNERSTNAETVKAYSVNVDFSKGLENNNTLFYGVEYVMNDVNSVGLLTDISTDSSMAGPARYPNATWQSIGVYVNDEFELSEKLTFLAGLRYNHFILNADFSDNLPYYPFPFSEAEINDGALTGSFGLVYRPNSSWVIKANFGTAFRSPNVDDIGKVFDSEPGAVVVPNPDLKAERAYNIDLGLAKLFGDFLKIDLTGYYTILNNALVRRDFQLNGQDSILYNGELSRVQAIQNAASGRVYGIQAGFELILPAGFSLSSDINWQYGEEELDDGTTSPSRHAAPVFGVSRLNYRYKQLHLQFYAQYQARRSAADMPFEERRKDEIYAKDENGENFAPAWYTLNIKGQYEINQNFSVIAGVENLSDRRYRSYSSGISGAGRNFFVSLQARF